MFLSKMFAICDLQTKGIMHMTATLSCLFTRKPCLLASQARIRPTKVRYDHESNDTSFLLYSIGKPKRAVIFWVNHLRSWDLY